MVAKRPWCRFYIIRIIPIWQCILLEKFAHKHQAVPHDIWIANKNLDPAQPIIFQRTSLNYSNDWSIFLQLQWHKRLPWIFARYCKKHTTVNIPWKVTSTILQIELLIDTSIPVISKQIWEKHGINQWILPQGTKVLYSNQIILCKCHFGDLWFWITTNNGGSGKEVPVRHLVAIPVGCLWSPRLSTLDLSLWSTLYL